MMLTMFGKFFNLLIDSFICYGLEIENLKIVKNQNLLNKTPADAQHLKASLYETSTITLLELPSLAPSIKKVQNTKAEVGIDIII